MSLGLKKGDMVQVIRGKDAGRRGKVLSLFREEVDRWVVVEKVALVKRHIRPSQKSPGGIHEKSLPIHASKVGLVCPKCDKPVRFGRKEQNGESVRLCKKCDAVIA